MCAARQAATTRILRPELRRFEPMLTDQTPARIQRASLVAILLMLTGSTCLAQSLSPAKPEVLEDFASGVKPGIENREQLKNYKGKNGVISVKTVVMGGDFRVTTIIPYKGDLADYHHLEITKPVSL